MALRLKISLLTSDYATNALFIRAMWAYVAWRSMSESAGPCRLDNGWKWLVPSAKARRA